MNKSRVNIVLNTIQPGSANIKHVQTHTSFVSTACVWLIWMLFTCAYSCAYSCACRVLVIRRISVMKIRVIEMLLFIFTCMMDLVGFKIYFKNLRGILFISLNGSVLCSFLCYLFFIFMYFCVRKIMNSPPVWYKSVVYYISFF